MPSDQSIIPYGYSVAILRGNGQVVFQSPGPSNARTSSISGTKVPLVLPGNWEQALPWKSAIGMKLQFRGNSNLRIPRFSANSKVQGLKQAEDYRYSTKAHLWIQAKCGLFLAPVYLSRGYPYPLFLELHLALSDRATKKFKSMTELVALITGGASGIGRATAHKLASRGISVVLADMNQEQGTAVANEVAQKWKVRTKFQKLDVTQEAEVKEAVAAAAGLTGRLDFAANCAGVCESVWDEEESITTELFERYETVRLC